MRFPSVCSTEKDASAWSPGSSRRVTELEKLNIFCHSAVCWCYLFFASLHSMWNLSSPSRNQTLTSAVGAQSLNYRAVSPCYSIVNILRKWWRATHVVLNIMEIKKEKVYVSIRAEMENNREADLHRASCHPSLPGRVLGQPLLPV